jgi:hypothetical protein
VVLAGFVYQQTRRRVRVTVTQVEEDIRNHLPVGSTRENVAAFLDRRKLPHSYKGEDAYDPDRNCEVALVPNTATRWPFRTDIQIHFYFDKQMKLASYSVKEFQTGP